MAVTAMEAAEAELLFFDTFTHSDHKDLNLDLIQFPKPVWITEIRVVPVGTQVHSDSLVGIRMGATLPSSFELKFFANNLSFAKVSSFELLGILNYRENQDIRLIPHKKVVTDGLVVRGKFSAITLAIYGCLTVSQTSTAAAAVEAENVSCATIADSTQLTNNCKSSSLSTIHDNLCLKDEAVDENLIQSSNESIPFIEKAPSSSPPTKEETFSTSGMISSPTDSQPESKACSGVVSTVSIRSPNVPEFNEESLDEKNLEEGERDPSIPDQDSIDMYNVLSDGEIQGDADYEEISSDDGNFSDIETIDQANIIVSGDWAGDGEDVWTYPFSTFNPDHCEFVKPETFIDPSLTAYEIAKNRLVMNKDGPEQPACVDVILALCNKYSREEHDNSWVQAMEEVGDIIVPGLVYIIHKMNGKKEVEDRILEWTFEGLSIERAMEQSVTAFMIRHLKMGIELAGRLTSCDPYLAFRMLSQDVQGCLLSLYSAEHMSNSMRLLIIQALDQTLRLREGIEWFLGKHHAQSQSEGIHTGYQKLIELITRKQSSRCMHALSILMNKIHLYEILVKLSCAVESLMNHDPERLHQQSSDSMEIDASIGSVASSVVLAMPAQSEMEVILTALETISFYLTNADDMLGQPKKKTLPLGVRFSPAKPHYDPYPALLHLLHSCRFLESIFVLLSAPVTCGCLPIFQAIKEVLCFLLRTQKGLLFLIFSTDVINGIHRILWQSAPFPHDTQTEETSLQQQLGMEIICSLQTLQYIDQLQELHNENKGNPQENPEMLAILHSLCCLNWQDDNALVRTLVLDENLTVLLPFLDIESKTADKDILKKSVGLNYAMLLLIMVLRNSSDISHLSQLAPAVLSIHPPENLKTSDRLLELLDWFQPMKSISSNKDIDQVGPLVELVKQYAESAGSLPKGLVTTLRILWHLAVPQAERDSTLLQYKYIQVELFSSGILQDIFAILEKVTAFRQRAWQDGEPFSSPMSSLALRIVRPALNLVKHIFQMLIDAQGSEFKDLSPIKCLLNVHAVFGSVSASASISHQSHQVQLDIVEILLCYTHPKVQALQIEKDQGGVEQSLWLDMLKELVKHATSAPYALYSGLCLLTELLPLPLPLQTQEPLTDHEQQMVFLQRKLWAAHLIPITETLNNLIEVVVTSSCQLLQQILKKLVYQISDLSMFTSISVVRCLLLLFLESVDSGETILKSTVAYRALSTTAFLCNHPAAKAAFLQLIQCGNAMENENLHQVLPLMLSFLRHSSSHSLHTLSQECIVAIFQSLCDPEVSLLPSESTFPLLGQLASCLPFSKDLELICSALFDHIGHKEPNYSSVHPALRTLTLLLLHDYGFYWIKKLYFANHADAFYNLFMQINATFSKDNSDCVNTLSAAVECIQFMALAPDSESNLSGVILRTLPLRAAELRRMLGWAGKGTGHPLEDLDMLLQDYAKEEETLKVIQESVSSVVHILLREESSGVQGNDDGMSSMEEPAMPEALPIAELFNQRASYVISDGHDDRLSSAFWNAPYEVSELLPETVSFDLSDIIQQYFPDYDLKADLDKGSAMAAASNLKLKKRQKRYMDTINTSGKRGGREFVAPMRGRGYSRGLGSRSDSFRSRPPNTSRPPSMHVDDFVKMESNSSTQPAPMGPPPSEAHNPTGFVPRGGRGGRYMSTPRGFHRNYPRPALRFSQHNQPRGMPPSTLALPFQPFNSQKPIVSWENRKNASFIPRSTMFPNTFPESLSMPDRRGVRNLYNPSRFSTPHRGQSGLIPQWSPGNVNIRMVTHPGPEIRDYGRHHRHFDK